MALKVGMVVVMATVALTGSVRAQGLERGAQPGNPDEKDREGHAVSGMA